MSNIGSCVSFVLQFYGLITVLPMMALELTPLDGIPAFTTPIRAALAPYWITRAEEFAAIARLSNASYGDGLAALGVVLELDALAMEALYDAAVAGGPQAADYAAVINLDVGDGLLLNELPAPAGADFAPPIDLPREVLLDSNLLPVLDQGRRNTCVAFTLVAMYQVASGDPTDLSEQFLFWACKQLDGMPDNPHGTTAETALQALQTYGICLEQDWPYVAEPIEGNFGHAPPPANALSAALQRRIPGGRSLEATTSTAVRAALVDGHPVLLGLLCYPFWKNS